ncbi:pyrroline-5-carboxylate reductase [Vagococcus penaei]|uniref:Pyrroline-5-carboxylate reductase n=1 Tax=Vagococcus penaei TaxID=633807 RepID=A0A1Q2D8M3_9ENTE|nr:pyrroline-5-carboxylate reductase [Vagococcus penaei]AQP54697.1 pyrroline-5-carboxylate reductase [Vagococcus penaei]RSU05350.1 pyrroline-5-carboxylate reductase [Vagococcus penaei]
MKIGILGAGHMGGAMLKGWLTSPDIKPEDVYVKGGSGGTAEKLQRDLNYQLVSSLEEFTYCDIIFIAVNTAIVLPTLTDLTPIISEKKIPVVSVSAGVSLDEMAVVLGADYPMAHAIPNTPVQIHQGTIGISYNKQLTIAVMELIEAAFKPLGTLIKTDEEKLGIFGTLAGCGPAFVDVFMEALADGAVLHGMDRNLAYEVAARMVSSSANLLLESGQHPGELKDQVTSPGGTTIKGITALEKEGFRYAVINALDTIMKA